MGLLTSHNGFICNHTGGGYFSFECYYDCAASKHGFLSSTLPEYGHDVWLNRISEVLYFTGRRLNFGRIFVHVCSKQICAIQYQSEWILVTRGHHIVDIQPTLICYRQDTDRYYSPRAFALDGNDIQKAVIFTKCTLKLSKYI